MPDPVLNTSVWPTGVTAALGLLRAAVWQRGWYRTHAPTIHPPGGGASKASWSKRLATCTRWRTRGDRHPRPLGGAGIVGPLPMGSRPSKGTALAPQCRSHPFMKGESSCHSSV